MTRILPIVFAAAALATGGEAVAQSGAVAAAINSGAVGEQADGYLGFPKPPSPGLKAEVDAINIKRRQVYTRTAQTKNVAIEAVAASVGCNTLSSLKAGRAYSVGGAWAVKGGSPITLPSQCGG